MFNIKIGNKTEKAMKLLNIQSFPFTESEVKSKFREMIKNCHPDRVKGNDYLAKKVIKAYTHIKNLAVSDRSVASLAKDILNAESANEDIFELFDDCKKCKGTGKIINHHKAYTEYCDRCIKSTRIFFGYYKRVPTGKIKVPCKSCGGTGKFKQCNSKKIVPCLSCAGKGFKYVKCPKCKGTKFIHMKAYTTESGCYLCGGTGRIKVNPFNPVIPKGAVL